MHGMIVQNEVHSAVLCNFVSQYVTHFSLHMCLIVHPQKHDNVLSCRPLDTASSAKTAHIQKKLLVYMIISYHGGAEFRRKLSLSYHVYRTCMRLTDS